MILIAHCELGHSQLPTSLVDCSRSKVVGGPDGGVDDRYIN